jgi:hypothetical protein
MNMENRYNSTDSIVRATIDELLTRAEHGKIKYNADLDRTDLIDIQYLIELKEELMDGILYLNKFLSFH